MQRTSSILLLLLTACAAPESRGFFPSPERARYAVIEAARDPWTWAPIAGGLVLDAGAFDRELGEDLAADTPVFGDAERAARASDRFLAALQVASLVSTAALDGAGGQPWSEHKTEVLGASLIALGLSGGASNLVQQAGGDDALAPRPVASAFSHRAWVDANLRREDFGAAAAPLHLGAGALAFGTAYARVETGEAQPSDVLVGAALGNFATRFVNEAFLGPARDAGVQLAVDPYREVFVVGMRWGF